MTKMIQVWIVVNGRKIGWTVVGSAAEAQLEADRARRQGFEPRIG